MNIFETFLTTSSISTYPRWTIEHLLFRGRLGWIQALIQQCYAYRISGASFVWQPTAKQRCWLRPTQIPASARARTPHTDWYRVCLFALCPTLCNLHRSEKKKFRRVYFVSQCYFVFSVWSHFNQIHWHSPIRIAPVISQMVAKMQADRMVRTPEPTLVPNELATSFAPIPNDSTNAITKPIIMIHNESLE